MNRARLVLTVCAALALIALITTALAAAPAATPAPTGHAAADAVFLASLATPAPAVGVPTPTPMACPTGFCAEARRQCNLDCAPCIGVTTCIISICDSTCSCQC
jgi:hypothetical protein